MDAAKDAFEATQRSVGHLVVGLQELKWEDVPQKAKEHIKNNPKMSAFQALSVLLLLVPGLVVGPVLAAIGFGSAGPLAGSAAAAYQSANGATAIFSTLQSAAMGGYGVAAVNGVVQGTSAVLAFGTGLMRVFRREGAEEAKVARPEQQPEKSS